jgi:hypothetical protein
MVPLPVCLTTGSQSFMTSSKGTAVVLQYFEREEEMSEAAQALDAMDASETPGRRASIDTCEVKLDRQAR